MKRFYLRGRKLLSMLVSLLRIQKLRFLGINVGSGCVIEGGVIFDKLFPELISIEIGRPPVSLEFVTPSSARDVE